MPAYNFDQRLKATKLINSLVQPNHYYLLLCNELKYYTVFISGCGDSKPTLSKELYSCLDNIGQIKSIEVSEDGLALEIWITNEDDSYCMYFFNYDMGVIKCQ